MDGGAIYRPCAFTRVRTTGGPRYLLAMCGDTEESVQNGVPAMDSEGTPGAIDLYILKPISGRTELETILSQENIQSGHNGTSGEVSIQRLGPHLFGFAIEDNDSTEGYSQTMRRIYLPLGEKLALAAPRINVSLDNSDSNACYDDKQTCEKRDFSIAPDTTSAADVYPLLVTESGRRGGKPLQANFKLAFDVSKGAYVIPEEVSAGY
ncbi:topoisomerase IV (plasmid) [Rhizobium lusitanum]|uniref:topoisomerase IV n=1 Tax=Rhizobium lusitanum TaxID=293958 RepID=UPI001609421D|nr:topoisomerase IV [Rhizobium lusitanum]QND44732.1 topoisomerase IV [Rhizobium lusitanum]